MKKVKVGNLAAWFSLALIFAGIMPQVNAVVLVKDKQAKAYIKLPSQAAPPEKLAAQEIITYIKKISGATLALNAKGSNDCKIFICSLQTGGKNIPQDIRTKLKKADRNEAFYIKTSGNELYLCGKTPIAALYASYEFLEMLGVSWFYPSRDETGEEYPNQQTIKIGNIDCFKNPVLPESTLNLVSASKGFNESLEWLTRNKLPYFCGTQEARKIFVNGSKKDGETFLAERGALIPGKIGGHSWFDNVIPVKKYFAAHPEYFPMIKGKRIHSRAVGGDGASNVQRCFSNPDVLKICRENVLNASREGRMIMLCPADVVNYYCHCPECIKMGTVDGKFSTTNLYHRFFSKIINYVLEKNPATKSNIEIWPYTEYRECPTAKDIKYDPKYVTLTFCTHQRCYVHRFDDPGCKLNVKQYENYKEWIKICPSVKFYDYTQYDHSTYAPLEYTMSKDFKMFARNHNKGWLDECNPRFGWYIKRHAPKRDDRWLSRWQLTYVLAKYSWNKDLDIDKLMAETYRKYYGKAYKPMAEYHELRRKLWKNAPGHAYYGGPQRAAWCLTVPGTAKKLDNYIEEAEKLAKGNKKIEKRIAIDKYFLNTYWKPEAAELKKNLSSNKEIVLQECIDKIKLDGDLKESTWIKARSISDLMQIGTHDKVEEKTSMRVAYDKDNFYFAIDAFENKAWSPVKADAKKKDGPVWADDSIEIQIVPPGKDGLTKYFHLICNTNGVIYDAMERDKSFNSNAQVKVKKYDDRYVYEIKVPVKDMGWKIKNGDIWKFFLMRNCSNLQPPQTTRHSSIDGVQAHRPTSYRRAVIGGNVFKNGNFAKLVPKDKAYGKKAIKGDKGLEAWGQNDKVELIEGATGNSIKIKTGGVLYGRIPVTRSQEKQIIKGKLRASGTGSIAVKVVLDMNGKKEPMKEIASFKLKSEPQNFKFEIPLEANQGVLIYFYGNDALLEFISGIVVKSENK